MMCAGVAALIYGLEFGGFLAHKACGSNWIIDDLNERGAVICVSQRPPRKVPPDIDRHLCMARCLSETFFGRFKEFKRIATRSDKTGTSLAAMIQATAAIINAR